MLIECSDEAGGQPRRRFIIILPIDDDTGVRIYIYIYICIREAHPLPLATNARLQSYGAT